MHITYHKTSFALLIVTLLTGTTPASANSNIRLLGASQGPKAQPQIMNVALQADGLVRGRVVEPDGRPLDGAQVVLRQTDRVVARVVTDSRGEFVAPDLGSGVYRIETPTSAGTYRFWRKQDAPPSAKSTALIVSQEPTLRGQWGYGNGNLLTLGVAAAGATVGGIALDKANKAEKRAKKAEQSLQQMMDAILTPTSP